MIRFNRAVGPLWNRFAALFGALEANAPSYDVIADCGRLTAPNLPLPLLWAADVLLLVIRPTLVSIATAKPTLDMLLTQLRERVADTSGLQLLVTGRGTYTDAEITHELGVPVLGRLPDDPRAATVLTEGGDFRLRWPLIRAALDLDSALRSAVIAHRRRVPPHALREGARNAV